MESSACKGLKRGANAKMGSEQNNAPCCFNDNEKKTVHVGELIIIISFTAVLKAEKALGENVREQLLQPLCLLFQAFHQCFHSFWKMFPRIWVKSPSGLLFSHLSDTQSKVKTDMPQIKLVCFFKCCWLHLLLKKSNGDPASPLRRSPELNFYTLSAGFWMGKQPCQPPFS